MAHFDGNKWPAICRSALNLQRSLEVQRRPFFLPLTSSSLFPFSILHDPGEVLEDELSDKHLEVEASHDLSIL